MKTLMQSLLITGVSLGMFLTAGAQEDAKNTAKIAQADCADEPNVEIASTWWPDLENTWVPIGWKDHPLRFNVLYNGTLISQSPPSLARGGIVRHPDRGQGVQLTFQLSRDGVVPIGSSTSPFQLRAQDGGVGDQGWCDQAAPVLWTRWRQGNLVLRQEVFAHMPGGGPVTTGLEPLFAWVRLSLEPSSSGGAFALVRISQPHIQTAMDRNENLLAVPAVSAYPRPLRLESAASRASHLLLDDTEQVRLAITSSEQAAVAFIDQRPASADTYLKIAIPAGTDEDVDLLVPLVPADRSTVEAELAIGRDAALNEANRHWAVTAAARFMKGFPTAVASTGGFNRIRLRAQVKYTSVGNGTLPARANGAHSRRFLHASIPPRSDRPAAVGECHQSDFGLHRERPPFMYPSDDNCLPANCSRWM